jgi:hypothetical protein
LIETISSNHHTFEKKYNNNNKNPGVITCTNIDYAEFEILYHIFFKQMREVLPSAYQKCETFQPSQKMALVYFLKCKQHISRKENMILLFHL